MGRRVAPNIGSNSQRQGDGDMASWMGHGNLTENQACGTHFGLQHPSHYECTITKKAQEFICFSITRYEQIEGEKERER